MLTMADMLDVGCVRYGKHGHEHILGSFKTSQRSGAKECECADDWEEDADDNCDDDNDEVSDDDGNDDDDGSAPERG